MASLEGWTIGFIGLGLMGRPMARNLQAAGARMIVHNRSPEPMRKLAEEGMKTAGSPAELAARADVIITMLTDTQAVLSVVAGKNGLLDRLQPGSLVIDMGTTKVPVTRELAKRVEAAGADYVDAPVSGGTIGADTGTLIIMSGGDPEAVGRAHPIFDVLGSRITHVGKSGAGQVAKAANQVIVGLTIGAVAEALTLAKRAGVDPAQVREALAGGFADSRVLEVHGQRMVEGRFKPGARATVQRKDMDQALELAESLNLALPATALNRDLYDELIAAGGAELDHAALIKVIDSD